MSSGKFNIGDIVVLLMANPDPSRRRDIGEYVRPDGSVAMDYSVKQADIDYAEVEVMVLAIDIDGRYLLSDGHMADDKTSFGYYEGGKYDFVLKSLAEQEENHRTYEEWAREKNE